MPRISMLGRKIGVPEHPALRMALGGVFIAAGTVGFLPVVGYWMIPVGVTILAIDVPPVRRFQRRMTVRIGNGLHRRWPGMAGRFGYGSPRPSRKSPAAAQRD